MKIGIIGFGVVGKAVMNTLSKKYKIVIFNFSLSLGPKL